MKIPFSTPRICCVLWLALSGCALGVSGCGSQTTSPAETAAATDPQKSAAAAQQGVAAKAASQQGLQADLDRRAAQKR